MVMLLSLVGDVHFQWLRIIYFVFCDSSVDIHVKRRDVLSIVSLPFSRYIRLIMWRYLTAMEECILSDSGCLGYTGTCIPVLSNQRITRSL